MTEEIKEKPEEVGIIRNKKGQFVPGQSGNPEGKGAGRTLSLVGLLKKKLEEIPEGEKISFAEKLIKKYLNKAIVDEDSRQQRDIINRIDGMPKRSLEVSGELTQNVEVKLGKKERKLLDALILKREKKI